MLNLDQLSQTPALPAIEGSDLESQADRELLKCEYSKALALYKQIPSPSRATREKQVYCELRIDGICSLATLGDFTAGASQYGLEFQVLAAILADDVGALKSLSDWLCTQSRYGQSAAFLAAFTWKRYRYIREDRDHYHGRLAAHIRQHSNNQVILHLDLVAALEAHDEASIATLLPAVNVERYPVLATAFRSAVKVGDGPLARRVVNELVHRYHDSPLLGETLVGCAYWLQDWTIFEQLGVPFPELDDVTTAVVGLARAADEGDQDRAIALLKQRAGEVTVGRLQVLQEFDILADAGPYWCDSWDDMLDPVHGARHDKLLAFLPAGEIRGRFLLSARDLHGDDNVHAAELSRIAANEWPCLSSTLWMHDYWNVQDWTTCGRQTIEYIDQCTLDAEPLFILHSLELPDHKGKLNTYLAGAKSGIASIPPARLHAVLKAFFDDVLKPAWSPIFKNDAGATTMDYLQQLYEVWPTEYALDLAYAYLNLSRLQECKALLAEIRSDQYVSSSDYLYLQAQVAAGLEDILLLQQAQVDIEALPAGHPAFTERVREVLARIKPLRSDLAGTMLHLPMEDNISPARLDLAVPTSVLEHLDAMDTSLASMNTASLIALQAKLLDLNRKISDSLQPAAADQVLYSAWNARLHQRELGPRGEQALQRLAKHNGHARVVIAIDEALRLESDPDAALTALAKALSRGSSHNRFPYLMGILRNRLARVNTQKLNSQVKAALSRGVDIEQLIGEAKEVHSWTQWSQIVDTIQPF